MQFKNLDFVYDKNSIDLGRNFKFNILIISSKFYEYEINIQLAQIIKNKQFENILHEVKIVYTYYFDLTVEHIIDISKFKVYHKNNPLFYELWIKCNIEDNYILPYKKAYLVITTKYGSKLNFKVSLQNKK